MFKRILPILIACAAVIYAEPQEESATHSPEAEMTLEQALMITFQNNTSLQMERLDPQIMEKNEDVAKAVFDPKVTAGLDYDAERNRTQYDQHRTADDLSVETGLSKKFSTGTTVELEVDFDRSETTSTSLDDKRYTDSINPELTITQSLLSGRGRDVNLANIRKARINTAISKEQLRRYVETLIYNVNAAYWNLFLEREKLTVYQESYKLALAHEHEVEIFIRNGKMAEIELSTSQGEVSSRREKLINARGEINKKRLALVAILNDHGLFADGWNRDIVPSDNPRELYGALDDVESYVSIALSKRPEIKESELKISREQFDLVMTKNGLLPKLDFFISLGRTDYANSFHSADNTDTHEDYVSMGLDFAYSPGRRADRARFHQDILSGQRAELSLTNLKDSINREVRQAYIDCTTDYETIEAVGDTRDLRRQSLKTQTIKFEQGKATNTDIANAQRDLLQSQINHTEAVIDYVKSRLRLHYLDGSLIERSGLTISL